jgi:hypothetical protein
MNPENLHQFNFTFDFDNEIHIAVNKLIGEIQEILQDNYVPDYKKLDKDYLIELQRHTHDEILGHIRVQSDEFCNKIRMIFHKGCWGCVLEVSGFIKIVLAPIPPWVLITLDPVKIERGDIKVIGRCSVLRNPTYDYFENLPRGSEMFIDAARLSGLARQGRGDMAAQIINTALSSVKIKALSEAAEEDSNSRYYADLPEVQAAFTSGYIETVGTVKAIDDDTEIK